MTYFSNEVELSWKSDVAAGYFNKSVFRNHYLNLAAILGKKDC